MGGRIVANADEDTSFRYGVLSMCSKFRLITGYLHKHIILCRGAIRLVNLIVPLYN